ncbi:MAG: zinc-binding dehydrogenase [Desulfobacterales bacterium]|nr:zinc-binding dehydrogenase [Desulfobacterales bacterium]
MSLEIIENGNPFGAHRVLEPAGVLPQPAQKVNNDLSRIWDNELLIDVQFLNIDSASFTQIKGEVGADDEAIKARILEIVGERGKMHNPVTGSGGMLIGTVAAVGEKLKEKCPLKVGDRIVSLVSLSLTPLCIEEILEVKKDTDQVKVKAKAVLFENSLYAKLPEDMPETLALAVLDVCGAPAQTARLVKQGETCVIIGAGGKSGILCAWEAKRRAGVTGRVIGVEYSDAGVESLSSLGICDDVIKLDATDALSCYEAISQLTDGKLADVIINCVNIQNTELGSIMMCKDKGVVYFFSMATSFTKAALGAEGIGKDVDMIIGNGYTAGHAEVALNVVRQSEDIRKMYEKLYV